MEATETKAVLHAEAVEAMNAETTEAMYAEATEAVMNMQPLVTGIAEAAAVETVPNPSQSKSS